MFLHHGREREEDEEELEALPMTQNSVWQGIDSGHSEPVTIHEPNGLHTQNIWRNAAYQEPVHQMHRGNHPIHEAHQHDRPYDRPMLNSADPSPSLQEATAVHNGTNSSSAHHYEAAHVERAYFPVGNYAS